MKEHRALEKILEPGGITAVYQPIVQLKGNGSLSLWGFECLSRGPASTNFEVAPVLFDYVRLKREEASVDRACVAVALLGAAGLPDDTHLGVNVHASTLARDRGFVDFLLTTAESAGIGRQRIAVEIVEHAPPWDGAGFANVLDELRSHGIRIALDDVGLGQSNFKMILDVCPDYLKLDRYFVEGCTEDANRQAVIEMLALLARRFGARVIAEGVQNEETVQLLRGFGVDLMQGYLFSRPLTIDEVPEFVRPEGLERVAAHSRS